MRTPAGYRDFYRKFVVGGWCGITHRPEHGGAGLPFLLGRIVEEMLCSANIAFALYPALTSGCYEAISHCANDALKAIYLPKIGRSEEHTSELLSLMSTSSAVFCLNKKQNKQYNKRK